MSPDLSSFNMYNSYQATYYNDTNRQYVYENLQTIHTCYPGHYFNTSSTYEDTYILECDPSTHQYNWSSIIPSCVTEMPCSDPIDFGLPVQVNNTGPGTYVTNHTVTYSCQSNLQELWVNGANHTDILYHSTCGWGDWTIDTDIITCPSKIIRNFLKD